MMPEAFDLYMCPTCGCTGIAGVVGGVGPWPGDGKIRCPWCGYRTVMEQQGRLVFGDGYDELCEVARALSESLRALHKRALKADDTYPMSDLEEQAHQALRSYDGD